MIHPVEFLFIDPVIRIKRHKDSKGAIFIFPDVSDSFKNWARENCSGLYTVEMDIGKGVSVFFEKMEDAALCSLVWK